MSSIIALFYVALRQFTQLTDKHETASVWPVAGAVIFFAFHHQA